MSDLAPEGLFQKGISTLVDLGVRPDVAAGALGYSWRNENLGGRADALNPDSGALGLMQWLGPRKQALLSKFGSSPSGEDQLSFMKEELLGPEKRVLDLLQSAKSSSEGYSIWGRSYERPGASALARAGVSLSGDRLGGLALSGPPMDFGQIRSNSLAALGTDQAASAAPAAAASPQTEDIAFAQTEAPWQKLMLLSAISQLQQKGTHQFVQVDYDPWKIASMPRLF